MHPTVDGFDWQKLIRLSSVRQPTDSITSTYQRQYEFSGPTGFSALVQSLFFAGARAVLVSHWPVSSNATKDLMIATFQEIARHGTHKQKINKLTIGT